MKQYILILALFTLSASCSQHLFLDRHLEFSVSNVTTLPEVYPDNVTVPFIDTLGCGACIRGGYVFCTTAVEGKQYDTIPASKCCKDNTTANCAVISNTNYTCSSTYSSQTYSKFLCPFVKSECGDQNNITLNNTGDEVSITVNLSAGQTCFYMINSECGVPGFTPNQTDGFDIEYLDYEDDEVQQGNMTKTNSSSDQKRQAAPANSTPPRNQSFNSQSSNSNSQGKSSGNQQRNLGGQGGSTGGQGGQGGQGGSSGGKDDQDDSTDGQDDQDDSTDGQDDQDDSTGRQGQGPPPNGTNGQMGGNGSKPQNGSQGSNGSGESNSGQGQSKGQDKKQDKDQSSNQGQGQGKGNNSGGNQSSTRSGPAEGRYNPQNGSVKFNNGQKSNDSDTLCKKRHMMVAVTNMNGTNATFNSSRLLATSTKSTSYNTMTITIQSTDFTQASNSMILASAVSLLFFLMLSITQYA